MFGHKNKTEQHHGFDPLETILKTLHECLTTSTTISDGKLICSDWNIIIRPEVEDLTDRSAVLNFHLDCPDWDEALFECCAGLGQDRKSAVGSAVGSFMFAFMHGIDAMQNNIDPVQIESEFAGKTHNWRVYRSNIVGMGDKVEPDFERFWNALKNGIIKRLGNQRMTYVKVYACKSVGADGSENITGECRVNDVPSDELSAIVAEIADKFEVTNFSSQKMFFFIRQDSQTLLPYPYRMNKLSALLEKVETALDLFNKCSSEEQYNRLTADMVEALGDPTLAEECFAFLPEICAERAFGDIQFSEQVQIAGNGETITVYKNQLSDFFPLGHLMFNIFDSGHFGEQTNELYRKLIGMSAIGGSVAKMLEKGSQLDNVKMASLIFNVSDHFEIR